MSCEVLKFKTLIMYMYIIMMFGSCVIVPYLVIGVSTTTITSGFKVALSRGPTSDDNRVFTHLNRPLSLLKSVTWKILTRTFDELQL